MENIFVREIMNNNVVTAPPEISIRSIAKLMVDQGVGSIVIVKENRPVGIITEKDIVKAMAEGKDPDKVSAGEIMSKPLITVRPNTPLEKAVSIMVERNVRRLPVVEEGELVGIITMKDIGRLSPELLALSLRPFSRNPLRKKRYFSGICDLCGEYSDRLVEIGGEYVCEECRGEV